MGVTSSFLESYNFPPMLGLYTLNHAQFTYVCVGVRMSKPSFCSNCNVTTETRFGSCIQCGKVKQVNIVFYINPI